MRLSFCDTYQRNYLYLWLFNGPGVHKFIYYSLALLFALEYDNTEVQVNYKGLQSRKTHQLLVYTDYGTNSLHENTDVIKKLRRFIIR
jgi:hypothetical protein